MNAADANSFIGHMDTVDTVDVTTFCSYLENNIKRRKELVNNDVCNVTVVGNRVISNQAASVRGLDKFLERAALVRKNFLEQEIPDLHSHSTIKRSDKRVE